MSVMDYIEEDYQNKIDQLKSDLVKCKEENSDLHNYCTALKTANDIRQTDNEQLKSEVERLKELNLKAYEAGRMSSADSILGLRGFITDLEADLAVLSEAVMNTHGHYIDYGMLKLDPCQCEACGIARRYTK